MIKDTPANNSAEELEGCNPTNSKTVSVNMLANNNVADMLRNKAIPLTLQRLAIAQILLSRPVHLTADQLLSGAREIIPEISRATVYNTLNLLQKKGLICELNVAPGRIVYDSNMKHHYHMYNAETGEVSDIPIGELKLVGTPNLPDGVILDKVDVIVRVRGTES